MITQIGPHRVKCGSVMDDLTDLTDGRRFDIIYTDPPWGQGTINYWQTLNYKHTGAERKKIEYNSMMNRLFAIYQRHSKNILFVEYGQQWRGDVQRYAYEYGFNPAYIVELRYRSGSKMLPMDLHIFYKDEPIIFPDEYFRELFKKTGYDALKAALGPFTKPGMTMFDPMCGIGLGARYAIERGLIFYGNEMNQKRLNETIKKLQTWNKARLSD